MTRSSRLLLGKRLALNGVDYDAIPFAALVRGEDFWRRCAANASAIDRVVFLQYKQSFKSQDRITFDENDLTKGVYDKTQVESGKKSGRYTEAIYIPGIAQQCHHAAGVGCYPRR